MATNLDSYKQKLRETVIEFKEKYDLCDEGVAEFLEEMDLEPLHKPVEFSFSITLDVNHDDPYEIAREIEDTLNNTMRRYVRESNAVEESDEYELVEYQHYSNL